MDKLVSIAGIVAILLVVGYLMLGRGGDIDGSRAHELVQSGARLVDVRTPEEYAAGHIEGAVNIPLQQLEQRVKELEPKSEPIVLYCRSGRRSSAAQGTLAAAGYTAVHNLGAMSRW